MILLSAAFLLFTSCNNDTASNSSFDSDTTSMSEAFVHGTTTAPIAVPDSSAVAGQVTAQASVPTTISMPQAQVPQGKGGAGLNPAHGEPGHRCDIAVGAPLNSAPQAPAPAKNATVTTSTTTEQQAVPAQAPMVVPAPTQATAAGMQGKPNPAHGQPGHRCDIQVGQPLP